MRNSEYKIKSVLDYRKCSVTVKSKARNMRTCKQLFLSGFRLGLSVRCCCLFSVQRDLCHFMNHVGMGA